ncbi:MAG: ABC transporter substrate-binding protein [Betaproteobacteria bacterium]
MRRQTLGMLAGMALLPVVGHAMAVSRFKIMMILWRGETEVEKGFREQLRVEGIDAELIVRNAGQDVKKIAGFVAEARQMHPDLVYVWGTPATVAAVGRRGEAKPGQHITDIPVVFTMVSAPVAVRLIDVSRLSGRNITGTSHVVPVVDQLKAIRTYRKFSRLGVIYNPAEANSVINIEELREEAQLQSFTLIEEPVPLLDGQPNAAELPAALARIAAKDPQFLYLGPDSFIGANSPLITQQAIELGLPTFSATEPALRKDRALFGLVSRYDNLGRLTAHKAAQILRDKKNAGAIPVETLTRFSLVIRMDVARRLSFYPPISMLDYAELIG